jgi:hypothetical protein
MEMIDHFTPGAQTDQNEPPDESWGGRRAKLFPEEKGWMAAYCVEHDFLVRQGCDPSAPRDTVASILVNQGSTPDVVVKRALEWIRIHWPSGPFDVTWYTPGGLVNATLHGFRKKNPAYSLGAQTFLFPGRVNTDLQAVSGPEAEVFVEKLDIDFTYAFLSAYAFDLEAGRTRFQYSEEVRLQRLCARLYADHKFLFLDSSKFKREGKHGYGLEELLDKARTVTIYTTSSAQNRSITDRFVSLCERLLLKGPDDPSRLRTMRLRIVFQGAARAEPVEHTGYLPPPSPQ